MAKTTMGERDRGSASVYFAVIALSVMFAAGLALDGGRKLAAAVEVREIADNAARACAQQLDPASIRNNAPKIDPGAGRAAGQSFASNAGASASVSTTGDTCVVDASMSVDFLLLPGGANVAGRGVATAIES